MNSKITEKSFVLDNAAKCYQMLIEETKNLARICFEVQFTDPVVFEGILLMVIAFRKGLLTEDNIDETIRILAFDEDILLDTIHTLFNIHDLQIPEKIYNVISILATVFPVEEDIEHCTVDYYKMSPKEAYYCVFESLQIGEFEPEPIKHQINFLEAQIRENPNNSNIQYVLGKKYIENNNIDKAFRLFRKMNHLEPEDSDVLYHLGLILFLRDDLEVAYHHFRHVLKIKPNHEETILAMAELWIRVKKQFKAVKLLCKFLRKSKDNYRGWELLGIICFKQKKFGLADICLSNSLKYAPENQAVLLRIGLLEISRNNYETAMQYFKKMEHIQAFFEV